MSSDIEESIEGHLHPPIPSIPTTSDPTILADHLHVESSHDSLTIPDTSIESSITEEQLRASISSISPSQTQHPLLQQKSWNANFQKLFPKMPSHQKPSKLNPIFFNSQKELEDWITKEERIDGFCFESGHKYEGDQGITNYNLCYCYCKTPRIQPNSQKNSKIKEKYFRCKCHLNIIISNRQIKASYTQPEHNHSPCKLFYLK